MNSRLNHLLEAGNWNSYLRISVLYGVFGWNHGDFDTSLFVSLENILPMVDLKLFLWNCNKMVFCMFSVGTVWGLLHINREETQSLREEQWIWTNKIMEKCPNNCVVNLILRKMSLTCRSLQGCRRKKPAFATGTALSVGRGEKWSFFQSISCFFQCFPFPTPGYKFPH